MFDLAYRTGNPTTTGWYTPDVQRGHNIEQNGEPTMNTNLNRNPHTISSHRRSCALESSVRAKQALAGLIAAGTLCLICPVLPSAMAQCTPEWFDAFTPAFFAGGSTTSCAIYDDGSGSKLLITGLSRLGQEQAGIEVWDGQAWSTIAYPDDAAGLEHFISVREDPSEPWILMADQYNASVQGAYVYHNGNWSNLQFPAHSGFSPVTSIIADPDPQSHDIYLVGAFRNDDRSYTYVYRWDGSQWHPLDTSSDGATAISPVWFDDGSGMALYVSVYHSIDGQSIPGSVARWDGSHWSQVGPNGSPVSWPSLAVFDDGSGPALWALDSSGDTLAKWDGSSWTSFPLEPSESNYAWNLKSLTINNTQELVWTGIKGSVWRWDGIDGEKIGQTQSGSVTNINQDPLSEALIAIGTFLGIDAAQVVGLAQYDGSNWSPYAHSDLVGNGAPTARHLLAVASSTNPDIANRLFVLTRKAGGQHAQGIATWDGSSWQIIGSDDAYTNGISELTIADLGDGEQIYANAHIPNDDNTDQIGVIAWDGSSWKVINTGLEPDNGSVKAMTSGRVAGSEPTLFLAGDFLTLNGQPVNHVIGLTADGWVPLGNGIPDALLSDMTIHNDGSGVKLYVSGYFFNDQTQQHDGVMQWDGSQWTHLGQLGGDHVLDVTALLSADIGNGHGQQLYAAGDFDDGTLHHVAVWDGVVWQPLGHGLPNDVIDLKTITTSQGLRVAALMKDTSGQPHELIYLWDGHTWSPMGIETSNSYIYDFTQTPADLDAIYIVGSFRQVNGVPSEGIARFGCTPDTCKADFNHDSTVDTRDFVSFLNAWAAGEPDADFNNDGSINTNDLTDFLNAWTSGC